ncbi:tryptophan--tRNA ligase [Candidatus Parcubacteria bacterium]|nr:MAG: tryptophan--tRNA ligase [Candidatus Parcubacteria bacterium]
MRVLSGVRPTSLLHIGNYFGAISQWLQMQEKHDCFFFIADLHAITEPTSYGPILADNTLDVAASYIAAGLNPKKCLLYVQSDIPEHTELAWIFSTLIPLGELERMTQYKDLQKKYGSSINAGLLTYPALMAADILIYKANAVPVGEDQQQHVELTRTIARKFNSKFGKVFPEPIAIIAKSGARLKSLTDPSKKMSKSDPSQSYIGIFDAPQVIKEKIMRATTDSGSEIKFDEKNKPAISNLLTIYHLFSQMTVSSIEQKFKGKGYASFKTALADLIIEKLQPLQEKQKQLLKNKEKLVSILNAGTKKARLIAQKTLKEVKRKIGLIV